MNNTASLFSREGEMSNIDLAMRGETNIAAGFFFFGQGELAMRG